MAIITDEEDKPQPQQPVNTQASQGSQPASFGNQYISIQDYLKANQTGGMGAAAAQNVQTAGEGVKTNIKKTQEDQQKDIYARGIDKSKVEGLLKDPTTGDTGYIKAATAALNNPLTPLDQRASYQAALSGVRNIQGMKAKGVGAAFGGGFLDQALGVASGEGAQVEGALSQYGNLGTELTDAQKALLTEAQAAENEAANNRSWMDTQIRSAITGAKSAESTRKANLAAAQAEDAENLRQANAMIRSFEEYTGSPEVMRLRRLANADDSGTYYGNTLSAYGKAQKADAMAKIKAIDEQMANFYKMRDQHVSGLSRVGQFSTASPLLQQLYDLTGYSE